MSGMLACGSTSLMSAHDAGLCVIEADSVTLEQQTGMHARIVPTLDAQKAHRTRPGQVPPHCIVLCQSACEGVSKLGQHCTH